VLRVSVWMNVCMCVCIEEISFTKRKYMCVLCVCVLCVCVLCCVVCVYVVCVCCGVVCVLCVLYAVCCMLYAVCCVWFVRSKGLKSRASAMRKIATDYKGDCSRIKDLVRFTASFATCARMKQFLLSLLSLRSRPRGLEVLAVKNKFLSPSALGYRDVNVTLRVELESGRSHIWELQVNLKDMLVAKELTHGLYEEVECVVCCCCVINISRWNRHLSSEKERKKKEQRERERERERVNVYK